MEPRPGETRYLLGGAYRRMAHVAWGDPAAPAVLCVHGLTRTGRDFDPLARALAETHHVICPDLPGRGGSDWLPDATLYTPASYVQALSHLLAAVGPAAWAGLAEEQLGALIAHDARHRSELLRTLDTYLACGTSKAATAAALGIRRQSLYDRLDRIERLLGVDLADADQQLGLRLGVLAWRLRTGIDPRVGFGG